MDGQSILDSIKSVKCANQDDYVLDKSKGTLTSAAIGAVLGMLLAHNRKQSLFMGAIIGGTIGGVIANFYVNK